MKIPKYHGIIPPMVTPLRDRDTLDVSGLEQVIERMIAGGVHGLFVLGTTGEAPSLSYRLRREVIERSCELVAERVPVLVGITDTSFVESVHLARHAEEVGADALVVAPPYYYPAGQAELLGYLEYLSSALPLPLFLYNMPAMTKLVLEPETVRACLGIKNIIGIKDSGGDLEYFKSILGIARERPDWTVLVGPEHLLAETVELGGHGGVNGGANLHPRLFVEQFEAACRGDAPAVAQLQAKIVALGKLYSIGEHASAIIKGLKCALSCLGICDDFMAEPFQRFRAPERARVEALLSELGLSSTAMIHAK